MNNQPMAGQPQRPDTAGLIKPEQILKIPPHLMDEQNKNKFHGGVIGLWKQLNANPQGSPEWNTAFTKLTQVGQHIKQQVQNKNQPRDPNQQNGINQQAPAQQTQNVNAMPHPQQAQPMQPGPAGAQNNANRPLNQNFSPKVLEKIKHQTYVAPASAQARGSQFAIAYINDVKMKHAQALQKFESASENLDKMAKMVAARQTLSPQEQQNYQERKRHLEANREEARNLVQRLMEGQAAIKKEGQAGSTGEPMKRGPSQTGAPQPNNQQGPSGQAHSVSSAIDAARKSDDSESAKMVAQAAVNQTANSQKPPPSNQNAATTQGGQGVKAEERPPDQRINTTQTPNTSQNPPSGQPYNLHQDPAMQRAYSNQNVNSNPFPQSTAQNTPHGHPQQPQGMGARPDQQPASAHQKFPIPRDMNIPPPAQAPFVASRPTLSNGPFSSGPVGQPLTQKHAAYVLEGEGERVLSKKKLEELVRQVTGSTGAEADDGETITADVEEVLLQVADDFVDQVIVSACKLAKLRSSATLELRDIQLILERNYNIRVPGFASDEVRAVRKVVPTPAWTQKLSAVQAAKVTASKRE